MTDTSFIQIQKPPEKSDWQMRAGDIVVRPTKGNEPNWFHRLMQRLIFGFRWDRIED